MPDPSSHRPPNASGKAQPGAAAADIPTAALDAVAAFHDFDIQVLYEILQVAQSDPACATRPYQALFPAHEAVLGQHGLSRATADSPYLRFLYRLPALRSRSEGLVDVFERVLVRVGITIESASEGSGGSGGDRTGISEWSVQRETKGGSLLGEGSGMRQEHQYQHDARRSSFSEFIDEEWRSSPRKRAVSRTSVSKLQDHSMGFGARMPETKSQGQEVAGGSKGKSVSADPWAKKNEREPQSKERAEQSARPRPKIEERPRSRAAAEQPEDPNLLQAATPERRSRNRPAVHRTPELRDSPVTDASIVGRGLNSEVLRRLELLWREDEGNSKAAQARPPARLTHDYETTQVVEETIPQSILEQTIESDSDLDREELLRLPIPTPAQLERDARTFNRFRMQDFLRAILRRWREATHEHRERLREPDEIATHLDQEALMRQAMKRWTLAFRLRKHVRNAQEFSRSLEERADRVRSFRLLAKAFTHWAEYGAEERQRTEAARRHILRLKYFHAWREITAANQLKARRFALRKFFGKWKTNLIQVLIRENQAEIICERKVARDAYWAWFWNFCSSRAPQWREGVLLRRYFSRWTNAVQNRQETEAHLSAMRKQNLIKKHLETWRAKAAQAKQQQQDAAAFQRAHTIARALPRLQTQLRLGPPARRTEEMVERRIVSQSFGTWAKRLSMAQQAQKVDAYRIARTAWTQWNENLRIKLMQQQHARRLVQSCLYKWVLAERAAHFKRVSEDNLLERTIQGAVTRFKNLRASLQLSHDQVVASRKRRLLQGVMSKWQAKKQLAESQSQQAQKVYAPRTTTRVLHRWCAAYNYNLDISDQADSALDFFRSSGALSAWRAAAATSRKRKLQAAYATVRIKQKKARARSVLQTWLERTNEKLSLVDDAETILHDRLWEFARSAFAAWVQALADGRESETTATLRRQAALLGSAVQPWAAKGGLFLRQSAQADAFRRYGAEKIAYECLRQLQLKVLERRNLTAKASTVRSWTDKRRARLILRRWAEATAHDQAPAESAPALGLFSGRSSELGRSGLRYEGANEPDDRARRRVAEWIQPPMPPPSMSRRQMEASREDQPALSPLPAYLSTPSKRAARARAMASESPSFTPRTEPRMLLLRSVLGAEAGTEDFGEGARFTGFGRRSVAALGGGSLRNKRLNRR